jgi:hypothetical protein
MNGESGGWINSAQDPPHRRSRQQHLCLYASAIIEDHRWSLKYLRVNRAKQERGGEPLKTIYTAQINLKHKQILFRSGR